MQRNSKGRGKEGKKSHNKVAMKDSKIFKTKVTKINVDSFLLSYFWGTPWLTTINTFGKTMIFVLYFILYVPSEKTYFRSNKENIKIPTISFKFILSVV